MEAFADWQLGEMVARLMDLSNQVALAFASVLLALRIFVEVFQSYTAYKFRFSIPQFVPILMTLIALLTYTEIFPMLGDAFWGIAEYIRGEAELTFRLSNIWEALKSRLKVEGEEQSMWELLENWAGYLGEQANPLDWIQNWWGLATALSWQALSVLIRSGMILFKNVVYAFMLIVGPIPLVLSLVPGFQGMAAHWIKNFIVVCYWNITLALLDAIMQALNVQILADIAFGGDEEMTIGLLTAFSALMYFFVPYLSSLSIGQTIVAMSGSKMLMAPLATAVGLAKVAASGGSSKFASPKSNAIAYQHLSPNNGRAGASSASGLASVSSGHHQPDIRKQYSAQAVQSRHTHYPKTRVFYGSAYQSRAQQVYELKAQRHTPSVVPTATQENARMLPSGERKPRYLLGSKPTKL